MYVDYVVLKDRFRLIPTLTSVLQDCRGNDHFGYAEDGSPIEKQKTPMLIRGIQDIAQIACGVNLALALDLAGNVWVWVPTSKTKSGVVALDATRIALYPTRSESVAIQLNTLHLENITPPPSMRRIMSGLGSQLLWRSGRP